MGSAVIGALRVNLGIDTAQFEKDIARSRTKLKGFSDAARISLAVAGAALVGTTIALGSAVKKTLGEMEALGETAQKIGVPIEELSKLKHVAELSGISFEGLSKGAARLSRNIVEAAQGLSTPIRAFETLGISIRNTDGSLKTVTEILPELAEKFSRMRDGPEKTAFAMQLMGRSGAELIPMLNESAAGMRRMMKEAEELGLVIDHKTFVAADQFGDNLQRLGRVWDGVVIQISAALAGPLAEFTDELVEIAKNQKFAEQTAHAMVTVMRALKDTAVSTAGAIATINREWETWRANDPALLARQLGENIRTNVINAFSGAADSVREVTGEIQTLKEVTNIPRVAVQTLGGEGDQPEIQSALDLAAAKKASALAQRELNIALAEGRGVFEETRTPLEAYRLEIERLNAIQQQTPQYADAAARAQVMAAATVADQYMDLAGTVGQALGSIFENNKGVAIATAVINTLQGITQALATYPPPLSFAFAAAQAAAGFAQVAKIRSTTRSSRGGGGTSVPSAGSRGGSGGAAASAGGGSSGNAPPARAINVSFTGLDKSNSAAMRSLLQELAKEAKDGPLNLSVN